MQEFHPLVGVVQTMMKTKLRLKGFDKAQAEQLVAKFDPAVILDWITKFGPTILQLVAAIVAVLAMFHKPNGEPVAGLDDLD